MGHPAWSHLARWAAAVSVGAALVVLGGGSLVWSLERHAPGTNLRHWGDALWWAVTTLTTVGYGEHYPVTTGGRLVAIMIMFSGVAILGAVAALVAFGFAGRLAQRLEAAVLQVESQAEHAGADSAEDSPDQAPTGRRGRRGRGQGELRELSVGVADADCAASLTWLLARLGWHPLADGSGLAWQQGGVRLRVAVRPWDVPAGITGRLTFGAGSPERVEQIARESLQHGFHQVRAERVGSSAADGLVVLRTASGFEAVLGPS